MEIFEIKIGLEGVIDSASQVDLTKVVMKAITDHQPPLRLTDITISSVPRSGHKPQTSIHKINSLKGRSKLIAKFLYENPGTHTTAEIRDAVIAEAPFLHGSIIHSYLNNLTGRGIIVRIDSGVYRIV